MKGVFQDCAEKQESIQTIGSYNIPECVDACGCIGSNRQPSFGCIKVQSCRIVQIIILVVNWMPIYSEFLFTLEMEFLPKYVCPCVLGYACKVNFFFSWKFSNNNFWQTNSVKRDRGAVILQ